MSKPMKIRLIEPGFEKMTGQFGPIDFIDGVSVNEVSQVEASRIANSIRVENVDDGKNPSDSQRILDSQDTPMDQDMVRYTLEVKTTKKHTREELEVMADKEGITALRVIGDPLGVKSSSIEKLIQAILSAEAGIPADGEVPQEPSATVEPARPGVTGEQLAAQEQEAQETAERIQAADARQAALNGSVV